MSPSILARLLPSPSLPAIAAGRIRLNLDSVSNTFECFLPSGDWGGELG